MKEVLIGCASREQSDASRRAGDNHHVPLLSGNDVQK